MNYKIQNHNSLYNFKIRSAHYTQTCTDLVGLFLHYYSRYMAGEKKLVEDDSDKSSISINDTFTLVIS